MTSLPQGLYFCHSGEGETVDADLVRWGLGMRMRSISREGFAGSL